MNQVQCPAIREVINITGLLFIRVLVIFDHLPCGIIGIERVESLLVSYTKTVLTLRLETFYSLIASISLQGQNCSKCVVYLDSTKGIRFTLLEL